MARWKLTEPHYINCKRDGNNCEWEYKEVNRANGREVRKKYIVPMLLDPKLEADWTHRASQFEDGQIIVATEGTSDSKDIIIDAKSVTPGMEPLDDEAREISSRINARVIPVEGDPNASYSERLLDKFIQQLAETQSTVAHPPATIGIEKLLESMTAMMEQNQKILSTLVERPRRI